jgi:hypothetical protein
MESKGLCQTCSNDKTCSFDRKYPVNFCEEFSINQPAKQAKQKKKK